MEQKFNKLKAPSITNRHKCAMLWLCVAWTDVNYPFFQTRVACYWYFVLQVRVEKTSSKVRRLVRRMRKTFFQAAIIYHCEAEMVQYTVPAFLITKASFTRIQTFLKWYICFTRIRVDWVFSHSQQRFPLNSCGRKTLFM